MALSGTVQIENIGFEKIICNLVANPNIRYLVLGGPESEGHQTGQAMKALIDNGIDKRKRIIGVKTPHLVLFNLPIEFIDRFRNQLELIDFNLKKILRSFVRPSGHATRKILRHFGRIHCMIQVLILQSHSVGG